MVMKTYGDKNIWLYESYGDEVALLGYFNKIGRLAKKPRHNQVFDSWPFSPFSRFGQEFSA